MFPVSDSLELAMATETVKEAVGLNDGSKTSPFYARQLRTLCRCHTIDGADSWQLLRDKQCLMRGYLLPTEIAVHTSLYR